MDMFNALIEEENTRVFSSSIKALNISICSKSLIEEENTRVSTKWQNANSNKEHDAASAKVINELSDDPEMVLQA